MAMIEVSVSVGAPRGRVTVTVGSNGDILGLELARGAFGHMAPTELASTVLAAVRKAQRLARESVDNLVVPLISTADATMVEVLAGEVDIDSLTANPPSPVALTA